MLLSFKTGAFMFSSDFVRSAFFFDRFITGQNFIRLPLTSMLFWNTLFPSYPLLFFRQIIHSSYR